MYKGFVPHGAMHSAINAIVRLLAVSVDVCHVRILYRNG